MASEDFTGQCNCGGIARTYRNPPEKGCSIRCGECWSETEWMDNEEDAICAWYNGDVSEQEPIGGGMWVNGGQDDEK